MAKLQADERRITEGDHTAYNSPSGRQSHSRTFLSLGNFWNPLSTVRNSSFCQYIDSRIVQNDLLHDLIGIIYTKTANNSAAQSLLNSCLSLRNDRAFGSW